MQSTINRLAHTPVDVAEHLHTLKSEARARFEDLARRIASGERPNLEVVAPILSAYGVPISELERAVNWLFSQQKGA